MTRLVFCTDVSSIQLRVAKAGIGPVFCKAVSPRQPGPSPLSLARYIPDYTNAMHRRNDFACCFRSPSDQVKRSSGSLRFYVYAVILILYRQEYAKYLIDRDSTVIKLVWNVIGGTHNSAEDNAARDSTRLAAGGGIECGGTWSGVSLQPFQPFLS